MRNREADNDRERTVHVISVGLSLRDNLEKDGRHPSLQHNWPPHGGSVYDPDRAPVDRVADEIAQALSPEEAVSFADSTFVRNLDPASWPSDLSAELQTFANLPNGSGQRLGNHDLAILLLSDTADGLLAGLGNGLALARGEVHRVYYQNDPEQPLPTNEGVLLVRVPDLEASDDAQMRRAMRHLGVLARSLHQAFKERAARYQFHMSGGFKATIPYLIGIAEGMRSLPDTTVEAYIMHEETRHAIRLPLCRFPSSWVRNELNGQYLDETHFVWIEGKPVPPRLLEGYAYEQVESRHQRRQLRVHRDQTVYELTPFGVGLKTLFEQSNESVG